MRYLLMILIFLNVKIFPVSRLPNLCDIVLSHPISHDDFSYSRGFRGGNFPHWGIDISTPMRTKIFAVRSGVIETAKWDRNFAGINEEGGLGFGYYIIIRYDDGHTGYYAHLTPESENYSIGERILAGEVLALSGNSGRSTGPHLHYGERDLRGRWIDPTPLIVESHYRDYSQIKLKPGFAKLHRLEKRKQRNCQKGEDKVKIIPRNQKRQNFNAGEDSIKRKNLWSPEKMGW